MDAIIGILTSIQGRYVLSLGGGLLLKRWPKFTNRWIPIALLGGNVFLALLNGIAVSPAMASGGNHTAWYASLGNVLLSAATSWLLAVGTHSAGKNSLQLLKP